MIKSTHSKSKASKAPKILYDGDADYEAELEVVETKEEPVEFEPYDALWQEEPKEVRVLRKAAVGDRQYFSDDAASGAEFLLVEMKDTGITKVVKASEVTKS